MTLNIISHAAGRSIKRAMAIVALVLTPVITNCGSDDDDGIFGLDPLTFFLLTASSGGSSSALRTSISVDLQTSQGLVVGGAANALTQAFGGQVSGASSSNLYSLAADGTMTVVQVFDSDSSTTNAYTPTSITNTTNYILLTYTTGNTGFFSPPCNIVLAQKSTNKLFCALNSYPQTAGLSLEGNVQTDASGNFYVMINADTQLGGTSATVSKIDVANPTNPTITQLVDYNTLGYLRSFTVDPASGDMVFAANATKIRYASGGLYGISNNVERSFYGADGKLYSLKIGSVNAVAVHTKTGGLYGSADVTVGTSVNSSLKKCSTNTRTYLANISNTGSTNEFFEVTTTPQLISVTATTPVASAAGTIKDIKCSSTGFVYIQGTDPSGNGFISKYTANGGTTFQTLLAAGAYVVSTFDVSSTGKVTFTGVRNSDGNKVVGEISTGDAVTILSTSAPEVTSLVLLN